MVTFPNLTKSLNSDPSNCLYSYLYHRYGTYSYSLLWWILIGFKADEIQLFTSFRIRILVRLGRHKKNAKAFFKKPGVQVV